MGATIEKIEDIDGRLGQSKTRVIVTTESREGKEITLFTERIIETIGRISFFEVKLDEERQAIFVPTRKVLRFFNNQIVR